MKTMLLYGILLISSQLVAQTQLEKDSLISVMCDVINKTEGQPDSIRIQTAYIEHLYPFLDRFPEEKADEIGMAIYYRFQRSCREFRDILDRNDPPKGDWESVDEKPSSKLNKKLCINFLKHKSFTYLEGDGDTTRLTIENGYWIDKFSDGTYSKLKFFWTSKCEFEIEFLESNNQVRNSFSKPGDRYRYQIIDKKDGYYDMSVEILGTNRYMIFKLYY